MSLTTILKCKCHHRYQDNKYGRGNRVFNAMLKENRYRCSVCGEEKYVTSKTK